MTPHKTKIGERDLLQLVRGEPGGCHPSCHSFSSFLPACCDKNETINLGTFPRVYSWANNNLKFFLPRSLGRCTDPGHGWEVSSLQGAGVGIISRKGLQPHRALFPLLFFFFWRHVLSSTKQESPYQQPHKRSTRQRSLSSPPAQPPLSAAPSQDDQMREASAQKSVQLRRKHRSCGSKESLPNALSIPNTPIVPSQLFFLQIW